MSVDLDQAEARARELNLWVDALDDAGLGFLRGFTGRSRLAAGDLVDAVAEIRSERSCRVALQARIETLEAIVARLHVELADARRLLPLREAACAA